MRWDQKRLASAAGVSIETVKRLEKMDGPLLSATGTTLVKIEEALKSAGVEFITNERGNGVVMLRK